jgi:hypothetical protein
MTLNKPSWNKRTIAHMSVETESGQSMLLTFEYDALVPGAKEVARHEAIVRAEEATREEPLQFEIEMDEY